MTSTACWSSQFKVLYCDDWYIAVEKPAGLFVHRSDADRSNQDVLLPELQQQLAQRLYVVHRLDRPTSGLLLLAKSSHAASLMAPLFAHRQVAKRYMAVVRGFLPDDGTCEIPLVPEKGRGLPSTHPFATPKPATTNWKIQSRFDLPVENARYPTTRCTLVNVFPKSGRFHQIRRHFNYLGYPILGDTQHGDSRLNRILAQSRWAVRHMLLTAASLSFNHPITQNRLTIACPLNSDFKHFLSESRTAQSSNATK